jgi:hypothetical protein
VRCAANSGGVSGDRSDWIAAVCSNSVKIYVPCAEVALVIRSARKRWEGDLVVVARRIKGSRAANALGCAWSMFR